MDWKSTINDKGLESDIVQILGSRNFKTLVWIETKHDYSIICQTKNDDSSNKKDLEGHVCKMYKEGRLELGWFKKQQEWKDGDLDNWIGGVLDICEDKTTFREYDQSNGQSGKLAPEVLVFNKVSQKWKKDVSRICFEDNDNLYNLINIETLSGRGGEALFNPHKCFITLILVVKAYKLFINQK